MHRGSRFWWLLSCLAVGLTVAGCGRAPGTSQDIDEPDSAAPELRIVSFSPALSRIAVDLGVSDLVVGRTPWCTSLDDAVPVVGRLDDADFERLVRLNPTHLLVQPPATGIHPELVRLAEERDWTIISAMINGVEDIRAVTEKIVESLAEAAPSRAESIRTAHRSWRSDLDLMLQPLAESDGKQTVLITLPGEPVLAFGVETYLGDVAAAFGLQNAITSAGWVELTLEDVARANPDLLIIVASTDGNAGGQESALGPLATLPIEAVRQGRWVVLEHPDAIIPSTSVVEVAAELKRKLAGLSERDS